MLFEEVLVILEDLAEDLVLDVLQAGDLEHSLLVEADVELVDGPASALEAGLGVLQVHLRPPPLPDDTQEASKKDADQGRGQSGHPPIATAPAPGSFQAPCGSRVDRFAAEPAPQVVGQLVGRWIPSRRLPVHGFQADRLQVARDGVVELARRPGLLLDHLAQDQVGRSAVGRRAGQGLVERRSQAVDVGPAVEVRFAAHLFGAHISRSPCQEALLGQAALDPLGAGQAEVGELGPARVVVDQDVAGLDVAMDQAGRMGRVERVGDLGHIRDDLPELGSRARPDPLSERRPRDRLHHQVRQAVGWVDHRMDGHGVVVAEPRRELGLADQPAPVGRPGLLGPEDLEGDLPAQRLVPGPVDDPHPAPAELLEQTKRPDRCQTCRRLRGRAGP
jgi:hypothetical protein